jgi:hypothetical protein
MKSQASEDLHHECLQSKTPFARKSNPRSRPYRFFTGDYLRVAHQEHGVMAKALTNRRW